MWPIPSCIWCYLYVVPAPTETEEQCSCLYNAGHVTWRSMLGYTPHPPLWTEFLTHTCENITFPQLLLRAVITCSCQQFTPKILLNFILQYSFFISTDNWLRDFLLYRLVQVFTVFLTALGQVQFVMRSENYSIWELIIGGSRGGREGRTPPPGVQILSISCSFRENLACSRPPWRVHAPPSGKSWIRHCLWIVSAENRYKIYK